MIPGNEFIYVQIKLCCFIPQRKWNLGEDKVFRFKQEKKNDDEFVPAVFLAEQTITYARELEMIV